MHGDWQTELGKNLWGDADDGVLISCIEMLRETLFESI